jgi:putative membrane protein
MLMGSLAMGGATVAQDDTQQGSQQQSGQDAVDDSQGMFRMGEAESIDQGQSVQDTTGGAQGQGGSGQQAQGAQPDAQGIKLMQQGLLPIPTDEQAFMNKLHHESQMEVQLGQLAQQKGVSRSVRDYGARLVKDHQGAIQKLSTYAQKRNVTLGEYQPVNDFQKTLMNAEQAAMAKLQSLQGPAFDRAFLAHMVGDHDADIAMVMAGQQQFANNTELRGQLDPLLTTLRQHRDQAYRLLGQEKPPRQARSAPQGR